MISRTKTLSPSLTRPPVLRTSSSPRLRSAPRPWRCTPPTGAGTAESWTGTWSTWTRSRRRLHGGKRKWFSVKYTMKGVCMLRGGWLVRFLGTWHFFYVRVPYDLCNLLRFTRTQTLTSIKMPMGKKVYQSHVSRFNTFFFLEENVRQLNFLRFIHGLRERILVLE